MPGRTRSKILEEGLRVFIALLGGNSHTIKGLAYLKIHPKTLRRILQTWEIIDIAKIKSSKLPDSTMNKWICRFNPRDYKKGKFKECYSCGRNLESNSSNFHCNARQLDGLQDTCRDCFSKRQLSYYYKNKERINKTRRKRYKLVRSLLIKRQIN